MPKPRRRERRPAAPATGVLDWTSSEHWSATPRPCRYCGTPTHLRDSSRKPADKVCAEAALQQRAEEAADAYATQRL